MNLISIDTQTGTANVYVGRQKVASVQAKVCDCGHVLLNAADIEQVRRSARLFVGQVSQSIA